ncbi:MAG: hypothetical protein HYU52_12570 [Acidobacteria bacterium]|nr:hypothetical protein [Acidobacteriota bacterium]
MSARVRSLSVALALVVLGALVVSFTASSGARPPLVSVGERLTISEPLGTSVECIGADVQIDSLVRGDVVVIGGSIRFGERGRIEGDLVALGSAFDPQDASKVQGRVVRPFWIGSAAQNVSRSGELFDTFDARVSLLIAAFKISMLLVWLALALLFVLAAPRALRNSSLEVRAGILHSLVIGLVAFTSLILTAIVLSYLIPYVIGIPLLISLAVVAIVAKVYGMVVIFHAVGTLLFGARTREELDRRRIVKGDLAMVVLGLCVLGVLRMIPVVGGFVWIIASLAGLGVAFQTRFGRREPWFLSLETNES